MAKLNPFEELEKLRPKTAMIKTLTKEQKEVLISARQSQYKVQWKDIAKLWDKLGWGKVNETSLIKVYKKECENAQ